MAMVSIDLVLMQQLVNALNAAVRDAPTEAARIARYLDDVWLSSPGLSRWSAGGDTIWQLKNLAQECQQRLDMARQVAASRPGETLVMTVSFDDMAFLDADAERAAGLIAQYLARCPADGGVGGGGAIPQELVDLLGEFGQDERFAADLAARLPADQLAGFLVGVNDYRDQLSNDVDLGARRPLDLSQFDQSYDHLLDGLADLLGLAARGMTSDQLTVFTGQYQAVFAANPASTAPALLSLVIGRGAWPDDFLAGVTTTILETAGDRGASAWGMPNVNAVVDPRFNQDLGAQPVVVDPLAGVFESASDYSPEWMVAFFHSGDTTTLDLPEVNDGNVHLAAVTASVDARLNQLFQAYGFDRTSGYWFGQAADAATQWQARYGDGGTGFATDVAWEVEDLDRRQTLYDQLSWWDKWGHEILFSLGMVLAAASIFAGPAAPPVVAGLLFGADIAVGVADATMYFLDGDLVDGFLSLGLTLVPVAIGGLIRWVRLPRAEVEALEAGEEVDHAGTVVTPADWEAAQVGGDESGTGFGTKAQRGPIQWVDGAMSSQMEAAVADRPGAIAAAQAAQASFDATLADLNQALVDAGFDPIEPTAFNAKSIDRTLSAWRETLADHPDVIEKLADMGEVARLRRDAINVQSAVGELMGEQAGLDLGRLEGDTPVMIEPGPGPGEVDQVWLSPDGKTLIVDECKGPSAWLGTRKVTLPDGTTVEAEQGSTAYLYGILRSSAKATTAIKADPELVEGLLDGSVTIEYRQVRPDPTGRITVRDFSTDQSLLDVSEWLS